MCELAVDMDSDWLMVDPWEAIQEDYKPTTEVLDHFDNALNAQLGGIETTPGIRKNITIVLVAGADLIQTMSNPKIWTAEELEHIFTRYLAFVVERTGTDINEALGALKHWGHRIHIIPQLVHNDVSSTKVRMCLKRQMSVRYLVPWPVITYIKSYGLFRG
jgi:nicotinamide mononucleotide adenylyltransferase